MRDFWMYLGSQMASDALGATVGAAVWVSASPVRETHEEAEAWPLTSPATGAQMRVFSDASGVAPAQFCGGQ